MGDNFSEFYSRKYPNNWDMIDLQVYKEMLYKDKKKIIAEFKEYEKNMSAVVPDNVINIVNNALKKRIDMLDWLIGEVQYGISMLKEE